MSTKPTEESWTATPDDGTREGDRLALMNELFRSMPQGAGMVSISFDDREVPAQVFFDTPEGASSPDLVAVAGFPPDATPALTRAVASRLGEE